MASVLAKFGVYLMMAMSILITISIPVATIVILCVSGDEHPNKPIRVWLGVFLGFWFVTTILNCMPTSTTIVNDVVVSESGFANSNMSTILQLVSLAWWGVGVYWMISGREKLKDDAPILFWYTAVILCIGVTLIALHLFLFSCVCCCGTIAACFLMKAAAAEEADSPV